MASLTDNSFIMSIDVLMIILAFWSVLLVALIVCYSLVEAFLDALGIYYTELAFYEMKKCLLCIIADVATDEIK